MKFSISKAVNLKLVSTRRSIVLSHPLKLGFTGFGLFMLISSEIVKRLIRCPPGKSPSSLSSQPMAGTAWPAASLSGLENFRNSLKNFSGLG
jgi:hypothetical protein